MIFTNPHLRDIKNDIKIKFQSLSERSKLPVNFYKTHFIQFMTKIVLRFIWILEMLKA